MNRLKFAGLPLPLGSARALATLLALFLGTGQFVVITAQAQGGNSRTKQKKLTDDQSVAQVLTRLTFGTRLGDFAGVEAIGVKAFITQQLDPDSIDDSALERRLGKLPTLALATPALIEQYTPPKPSPSPSPRPDPSPAQQPAPQPTALAAIEQKAIALPALETGRTEQNMKMEKPELQTPPTEQKPGAEEKKKSAQDSAKKSEPAKTQPAAPKPQKSPQMVVTELQRAALLRAVYSERQLYEVMVNFWENHFSIFANKDADRFMLTEFDRDVIRPSALGRFRDLLRATAHSSAMLYYLDNWQSSVQRNYAAANGKPARTVGGLNENYARELMELHTLGVDGGYTQKDVQEVARCFTGWTIRKPNEEGLFFFNPAAHDNGEKLVLGHKIPAGGGINDGERVLDILANHPSTARFIATKLARRFVDDDPPLSVVERAADAFLKTDGSIRETLRTIITSPELFSAKAYRTKIRSPFEYTAAALRALNAETDADRPLLDWIARMGQQVFGRLTPDGYPDRADQWLATGSMLERLNFATALSTNKIKGTRIEPLWLLNNVDLNNPAAVADHLAQSILSGEVSQQTRHALEKIASEQLAGHAQVSAVISAVNPINYAKQTPVQKSNPPATPPFVAELIMMVIGAPEFQRR
jgi:uncharacterized protein (DUF1800 family)